MANINNNVFQLAANAATQIQAQGQQLLNGQAQLQAQIRAQGVQIRAQGAQGQRILNGQAQLQAQIRAQGAQIRAQGAQIRAQGAQIRAQGAQLQQVLSIQVQIQAQLQAIPGAVVPPEVAITRAKAINYNSRDNDSTLEVLPRPDGAFPPVATFPRNLTRLDLRNMGGAQLTAILQFYNQPVPRSIAGRIQAIAEYIGTPLIPH